MKDASKPLLVLSALLALGCGNQHATNFGGAGACSSGAQPLRDTAGAIVPEAAGKPLDTLRVATFNMSVGFPVSQLLFTDMSVPATAYKTLDTLHTRYARGRPSERIMLAAKAIVDLDLDVVGLQEVETLARDSVLENDFIKELAADVKTLSGLDYQVLYIMLNDTVLSGARDGNTISVHFSEGDAMLIKPGFQIEDSANTVYFHANLFPLDDTLRVQRAFNYARLRSPRGTRAQIYNTHLEVYSDYANAQAGELKTQIACQRLPGYAQIVLGDFNVDPGTDAHTILSEDGFYDTHHGVADSMYTTCCLANSELWNPAAGWSARRIDFILAKGITKVLDRGTALETPDSAGIFSSDHRMVKATLELQ
jgi:endonuclease/exonuclease/phosphatase family metal-dependent hydrolase